jgi:hypothetical protein
MEFGQHLSKVAKEIILKSSHCKNEEMTKQFLILPFIRFLGYDILDPEELVPEHSADFDDRHKNRVDYAICREGVPVIAIEAKMVGNDLSRDLGQIRGYFNAITSIKLGIITDGLRYFCHADTIEKNIMDERAFLSFSLQDLAEGKFDEATVNGVRGLRKETFDPSEIAEKARDNLLLSRFTKLIGSWIEEPPEKLVRLFLESAGFEGKMVKRVIEETSPLVVQAFTSFLDRKMLERIGFAEREVFKIEKPQSAEPAADTTSSEDVVPDWAIPTESETLVFEYCGRRLAFLVKDEALFREIDNIKYAALKNTFIVYYKKRNQGRLFNFRVLSDNQFEFMFPEIEAVEPKIVTNNLSDIDQALGSIFMKRAQSLK